MAATEPDDDSLYTVSGGIGRITFDRPQPATP
jgi:hypothetical protein